jgi:hypothetical protein
MKINNLPHFRDESLKGNRLGSIRTGIATPAFALCRSSSGKSRRSRTRRSWRSRKIPSKSRAPDTSMAINASPAKKPLTARLALPALTGERERNQNHSPLTGGEGARRRRAGEGSLRSPLDFHGALVRISHHVWTMLEGRCPTGCGKTRPSKAVVRNPG